MDFKLSIVAQREDGVSAPRNPGSDAVLDADGEVVVEAVAPSDFVVLDGVYTKLLWDLIATEDDQVHQTGGKELLPLPNPDNFEPADGVNDAMKLAWLTARLGEGWLDAAKAALATRFSAPPATTDNPVTLSV